MDVDDHKDVLKALDYMRSHSVKSESEDVEMKD